MSYATEDSLQRKFEKLFSFTGEDLSANQSGFLTPRQEEILASFSRSSGCSTRLGLLSVVLTAVVLLAVFYHEADSGSAGFKQALPFYIGTLAVFVALFLFFTIRSEFRSKNLRNGRISTAEGEIHTWKKEYELGTAFFATVGGEKFILQTSGQFKLLSEYSYGRVYYVRNPPANLILSMQISV